METIRYISHHLDELITAMIMLLIAYQVFNLSKKVNELEKRLDDRQK